MSINFITMKTIAFSELFDGRLEKFVISGVITDPTTSDVRCLTDGRNYLWAYEGDNGTLAGVRRWGHNAPGKILSAISEAFDTDIVSEYEPQYWGFDTQEELDLAMEAPAESAYVYSNIHISPGSFALMAAEIAKDIVAEKPEFAFLDNRSKLHRAIEEVFQRKYDVVIELALEQVYQAEHGVVIKLDERDIAAARMAVTHEDDLPQV